MKTRILAVLLSVAVTLSGIPAMNVSANPVADVTEEVTAAEETVTEEAVTEETVTEEAASEETVTEEAVTEETVTEEAVSEETVTEEAVTEETVTEEAAPEEAVTEEVATEESATEETVTEEATVEETVVEETIVEETEEETVECEAVEAIADSGGISIGEKASNILAVGSNGIAYTDVAYLSKATVKALSAEAQSVYYEMCDNIADLYESGAPVRNVVIAVDNEKLRISYSMPARDLFTGGTEASLISENVELLESYAVKEEIIDGVKESDFAQLETLLSDGNYFRKQLSAKAQVVYDAGKKSIIQKGSNSIKVSYSGYYRVNTEDVDGISALINTYPYKFGWMDLTQDLTSTGYYYYASRKSDWTFTLPKSTWYSSDLETKAEEKVKNLVDAAYANAVGSDKPTYKIVKYLHDWIINNSYYKERYTYGEERYFSNNCYGVLLKGYGVCESYALAMTRLLDAAGIPNQYVMGNVGGEGHAWNYVQMPDGKWYLLDSTWNDTNPTGKTDDYFLVGKSSDHKATGKRFVSGQKFKFATLASTAYSAGNVETFAIDKTEAFMKKGDTLKLKVGAVVNPKYYAKMRWTLTSSDESVATVDKDGKVKAKGYGKSVITYSIFGKKLSCDVYVYKFTGLTFNDNAKSSNTWEYINSTDDFSKASTKEFKISVGQQNEVLTAEQLQTKLGLAAPKTKIDKTSVAEVTSITLSKDTITLKVKPKAIGTAKITVSYGGKSATLTVKATQQIKKEWFDTTNIPKEVEYSGSAFKPKVKTVKDVAPKKLTYKVTYENNKNAGKATVVIKGTGKYGGEIRTDFTILPKDITNTSFSCSTSKSYNGKEQKATIKVKVGKTTLKAGTDYEVTYNGKSTVPTNVGQYTVKIKGIGNYKGTITQTKTYEIKPVAISKVKVTCKTVKYTGNSVVPKYSVKIGSNVVPTSDYTVSYIYKDGTESKTAPSVKGKHTLVITPKGNNVLPTATKTSIKVKYTIK